MSQADPDPFVLVDGSSYLYRAYHALPPLTTSSGQPTGAIKGVINMLKRLQKDYCNSVIVVIFDAKGKTFRDAIFSDYKANRPPMPDDLRSQLGPIKKIIKAMGLPMLSIEGVEADDVIGTLSYQLTEEKIPAIVSTGDKDMAQLVNQYITLVNTMTNTTLDVTGVNDKFGIRPENIIDFLALMGDKVDNIPGVAGVGEKTALSLIQNLGGIDSIFNQLEKIPDLPIRGAKKLSEKLIANHDNALLSYKLATIKKDVDLPVNINDLINESQSNTPCIETLKILFKEFEFKSWLLDLDKSNESTVEQENHTSQRKTKPEIINTNYELVLSDDRFKYWVTKLKKADLISFDTETTSLNYIDSRIVGISVSCNEGTAAYIPFSHEYEGVPQQLSQMNVLSVLKPILESHDIKKVGQNLKYDKHLLANHGITLEGIKDDTMLMSYVINSTGNRHDMDTLASVYLNKNTTKYEDVTGKGAKQIPFQEVPLDIASNYAAEDADITLQLQKVLSKNLSSIESLQKLYSEIELPLLNVLTSMERNGALIDSELLLKQSREISKIIEELEKKAHDLAGEEFNLSSPKQLQTLLFEKLKLPIIKKTPKGQPSTAEPILQELALDYPLPKVIMHHRTLTKLKTTYTDRLPEQINSATGRIHSSYHQAVTATGRLSSSDPNLQNIPIKSPEGRKVRQAFIAPSGYKILAADYSQIELRIMAHLSGDTGLLNAFNSGLDVHKATASEVFSVGIEEVSQEQRRCAKAINFGLIYGMSSFGLAKQLDISRNDAEKYKNMYFERYPDVLKYMEETRLLAAEQGYVETLFGRRLYLSEINSNNAIRRKAAERTAINAPMQGTAADIIKVAMINVHGWLKSHNNIKLIMQVHDELVFEVPSDEVSSASSGIEMLMSNAAELSVPLVVDIGVGGNWDEAH